MLFHISIFMARPGTCLTTALVRIRVLICFSLSLSSNESKLEKGQKWKAEMMGKRSTNETCFSVTHTEQRNGVNIVFATHQMKFDRIIRLHSLVLEKFFRSRVQRRVNQSFSLSIYEWVISFLFATFHVVCIYFWLKRYSVCSTLHHSIPSIPRLLPLSLYIHICGICCNSRISAVVYTHTAHKSNACVFI